MKIFLGLLIGITFMSAVFATELANERQISCQQETVNICGKSYKIYGPGVWPLFFGEKRSFYFVQNTFIGFFDETIVFLKPLGSSRKYYRVLILNEKNCEKLYEGYAHWQNNQIEIVESNYF